MDPIEDPELHLFPYPKLENLTVWDQVPEDEIFLLDLFRTGEGLGNPNHWRFADLEWQSTVISKQSLLQIGPFEPATHGQLGLVEDNFEQLAKQLLPMAVSYSTGLLNYFFRGQLAATGGVDVGNGFARPYLEVRNIGFSELGDIEKFRLYVDDHSEFRWDVELTRVQSSGTTLPPGQSVRLFFPRIDPDNQCEDCLLTAVYSGPIDDEDDAHTAVRVENPCPALDGLWSLLSSGETCIEAPGISDCNSLNFTELVEFEADASGAFSGVAVGDPDDTWEGTIGRLNGEIAGGVEADAFAPDCPDLVFPPIIGTFSGSDTCDPKVWDEAGVWPWYWIFPDCELIGYGRYRLSVSASEGGSSRIVTMPETASRTGERTAAPARLRVQERQ